MTDRGSSEQQSTFSSARSAGFTSAGSGGAAADRMQQAALDAAQDAKQGLEESAEQQKGALTSLISDVAESVQTVAIQLREHRRSEVAGYAESMGAGLERMSRSLERKHVNEIVGDVIGFARTNPAAFLSGAFVAGVVLGRFAKASSSDAESFNRFRTV